MGIFWLDFFVFGLFLFRHWTDFSVTSSGLFWHNWVWGSWIILQRLSASVSGWDILLLLRCFFLSFIFWSGCFDIHFYCHFLCCALPWSVGCLQIYHLQLVYLIALSWCSCSSFGGRSPKKTKGRRKENARIEGRKKKHLSCFYL